MKSKILGAYQTKFGELWDRGLEDLLEEAGRGAMKDAGMTANEIDLVIVGNKLAGKVVGQDHLGALVNEVLGITAPTFRVEAACASGGVAVAQAVAAVEAGQADNVLVIGVEKMTDVSGEAITDALMGAASACERAAGLSFVGLYALMAQAYFAKYGAGEVDLAKVAAKNHWHGSMNDKAQYRFEITEEMVMRSAKVAEPLKLLDCSPVTDGAAAVVVGSKGQGIKVLASKLASESLSLLKRDSLVEIDSTKRAAKAAYEQAGLGPEEINLAEVHDCFTIAEILATEDLGFYGKGDGYLVQSNGEVRLGGKRPINLSGGLKACGHPVGATGVKQVVEVVMQLRGVGGERQVDGARVGLTHNVGGTGGTVAVHILTR